MRKISLLFLLLIGLTAYPQEDCFPKKSNHLVNDYVGILNLSKRNNIEKTLVEFSKATGVQIAIVIVSELCGYDKANYATILGEKWGVGQKGKDNGIVMLIKPTGSKGQRGAFIAIGYGLESVIPDVIAKEIIDREMIPHFKKKDFHTGISSACMVLMKLAQKEFSPEEYSKTGKKKRWSLPVFIVLLVILVFVFNIYKGARSYALTNSIGFWTALIMISTASRSHRGYYNSFSSGSNSFGGLGSGSGFSGFGSGSFGGGGAGGSW